MPLDNAILEAFIYLNATKNNILIIVLIFVLFNLIGSQIRKIVFLYFSQIFAFIFKDLIIYSPLSSSDVSPMIL